MEKKIRIGVIGLQGYGSTYFSTIMGIKLAEIWAICDTREDILKNVAERYGISRCFTDYRRMLEQKELDAVFIATPHFLHYRMTMDALRAGKHVFCEKPLAMNRWEAQEMVQTADRLGLTLSCHYNRRQSAQVKLLRQAVREGTLGEIYAMNVKWMARYTSFLFSQDSSWRTQKDKAGGGILIGRGSHMIDAALYILDSRKIGKVSANVCSRLTGLEVDDYCMLTLRMKNGPVVTIECSYENHIPQYRQKIEYQLFGTKAGAFCREEDGVRESRIGFCGFPENSWTDLSGRYREEDYEHAYPNNIVTDFLEAVYYGRKPAVTAEEAMYVTDVIDLAYQSAAAGREMEFEEKDVSERVH